MEKRLEEGAVYEPKKPHKLEEKHVPPELPKAVPKDVEEAVKNWRQIVSGLPGLSRTFWQGGRAPAVRRGDIRIYRSASGGYYQRK